MLSTAIMLDRMDAVAAAIARIRAIEAARGPTPDGLGAILEEMLALAARPELFPVETFPAPHGPPPRARRYHLSEDPDGRFSLHLNALSPGVSTPPHDHPGWAVLVALEGQERNRLFDPPRRGEAPVLREERMVEPGRGLALPAGAIHAIDIPGPSPARHLHLYGLALERRGG
ncbi:cysteine dioxygenase [Roseomonas sp. OT10]|uniref:cysteine dioxygenase family protein n=1 Tax=Roseomonas cutis TaxID=2897332 RepID=UPI001E477DDF|nr:cysteine dioxygenase [Roseomonas sp. OT10]UFN47303.1 cysteine dioxygenase [Roseomonas sp. OT10]